jgi:hypothetical protein
MSKVSGQMTKVYGGIEMPIPKKILVANPLKSGMCQLATVEERAYGDDGRCIVSMCTDGSDQFFVFERRISVGDFRGLAQFIAEANRPHLPLDVEEFESATWYSCTTGKLMKERGLQLVGEYELDEMIAKTEGKPKPTNVYASERKPKKVLTDADHDRINRRAHARFMKESVALQRIADKQSNQFRTEAVDAPTTKRRKK